MSSSSTTSTVDEQFSTMETESVATPTQVKDNALVQQMIDQQCGQQEEGPDLGLSSDDESDAEGGSSGDTFTDDSVVDWLATESFENMDSDEVRKSFEQHSVDYDAIVQDPQACRKFLQSVRRDLERRGKSVMSAELMDRLDDVLCAEKSSTEAAQHNTDDTADEQLNGDANTTQDGNMDVEQDNENDIRQEIDFFEPTIDTVTAHSPVEEDAQTSSKPQATDAIEETDDCTAETESQIVVGAEQGNQNETQPVVDGPDAIVDETICDEMQSENVPEIQAEELEIDSHVADAADPKLNTEENDQCAEESHEDVVDVDCYVTDVPCNVVDDVCSQNRQSCPSESASSLDDDDRESAHCDVSIEEEPIAHEDEPTVQENDNVCDKECDGEQIASQTDGNKTLVADQDDSESESVVFEDCPPYQYVVVGFPGYKPDIFAIETPCVTKVPARFADRISEGYVVRMMRIASFEEEKIRYSRNKPVARQLVNMTIEPTDRKEPFLLVRLTGEDKFRIMTTRYAEKIGAEKSETPVTIKGFQVSTIHFAIDREDLEEHWLYKPSTRKGENGEPVVVWQQFWMSDSRELCVRQPDQ